jgi:hypothetical protein
MSYKTVPPSKLEKTFDPLTGKSIISLGSKNGVKLVVLSARKNLCKDSQHKFRMMAENNLRLEQTSERLLAKLSARGDTLKK